MHIEQFWPELAGRYEFIAEIAPGQNGITYQIRQRTTQQLFCLKTISPHPKDPIRAKDSLSKEAENLSPLSHMCLPQVYEVSKKGADTPYYVCTFHPGVTLRKHLEDVKPCYTVADSHFIFQSLLHLIDYIHQKGVTHCDLHSDNILISNDLHKDGILVIDFGSSHRLEDTTPLTDNRGAPQFKMHEKGIPYGARVNRQTAQQSFRATDYFAMGILLRDTQDHFFVDASPVQKERLDDLILALTSNPTPEKIRRKLSEVVEPFSALSQVRKEFEGFGGLRKTIPLPINREVDVGDGHLQIINTIPFQRLRCIKQLSFCDWFFPGAVHTRFEHSLGVFNLVYRAIEQLSSDPEFRNNYYAEQLRASILAGLLHDVGHYPFAHTIEQYAYTHHQSDDALLDEVSHDRYSTYLVQNDLALNEALTNICGKNSVENVVNIILGEAIEGAPGALVKGPIDCDKLDYLYRDALHCGVPFGSVSYDPSILSNYRYINGTLGISEAGIPSFEGFAILQDQMLTAVYWHPYVRGVHAMFHYALELITNNNPEDLKELVKRIQNCQTEAQAIREVIVPAKTPASEGIIARLLGLHDRPNFSDIYRPFATYRRHDDEIGGYITRFVVESRKSDDSRLALKEANISSLRKAFAVAFNRYDIDSVDGDILIDIPIGRALDGEIFVQSGSSVRTLSETSHLQKSLFMDPAVHNSPVRVFVAPEVWEKAILREDDILNDVHQQIKDLLLGRSVAQQIDSQKSH